MAKLGMTNNLQKMGFLDFQNPSLHHHQIFEEGARNPTQSTVHAKWLSTPELSMF
jgi:hypothetical protein